MNQTLSYEGLDWIADPLGGSRLIGTSEITPIRYVVDYSADANCSLFGVFSQNEIIDLSSDYVPHTRLGVFPNLDAAVFVAERHDFTYFQTYADHEGADAMFVGSDRIKVLRDALGEIGLEAVEYIPGDYICPNGRPFTRAASYFAAKKTALKQNSDGSLTLQISIDADQMPVWMLNAPMGTLTLIGAVQTGHEDDPDERAWKKRATDAFKRSHTMINEPGFQEWLGTKYDRWHLIANAMQHDSDQVAEAAEETLKRLIGVPSRADIKTSRDAVERLERYDREYYKDLSLGFGIYHNRAA